jgi:uncharacterized Fe-S cluster-containing MiaB family protein
MLHKRYKSNIKKKNEMVERHCINEIGIYKDVKLDTKNSNCVEEWSTIVVFLLYFLCSPFL